MLPQILTLPPPVVVLGRIGLRTPLNVDCSLRRVKVSHCATIASATTYTTSPRSTRRGAGLREHAAPVIVAVMCLTLVESGSGFRDWRALLNWRGDGAGLLSAIRPGEGTGEVAEVLVGDQQEGWEAQRAHHQPGHGLRHEPQSGGAARGLCGHPPRR